MTKILVVAPGRRTRGGITSVIKALEKTDTWNKYSCRWIETYIDRSVFLKIVFFLKGFISYLFLLPFYDAVHIHYSWTISAYRKFFFFLFAKLLRKDIILHLHSGAEPIIKSKAFWVYNYMFKKAAMNVFLANAIRIELGRYFEITNSEIIYNPCTIPINIKESEMISNNKEMIILFAGTITEKKGTNDLIRAFGRIAEKFPKWKLVLAGNGEIEKGKMLAKELNIQNKVEFPGWISGREKDKFFRIASIFCLPSYTEGFPMAVLDAWAYGIPVVTTPVGGLPDVLIQGENAMVFEPGEINNLEYNLEILISNKDLRLKLSSASIKLSQELFHINKISLHLDELYSKVKAD